MQHTFTRRLFEKIGTQKGPKSKKKKKLSQESGQFKKSRKLKRAHKFPFIYGKVTDFINIFDYGIAFNITFSVIIKFK